MKSKSKIRGWMSVLSSLLAIFLIVFLFWIAKIPLKDFWRAIESAGWGALVCVMAIMFLQLIFQSISWKILLRGSGYRCSFFQVLWAILSGWSGNYVTPSMYLGGEPLRAYVLSVKANLSFGDSLASVLVHKFLELTSFISFIISSSILVFYFYHPYFSVPVQIGVLVCMAGMTLFFLLILRAIVKKKRLFSEIAKFFSRRKWGAGFWKSHLAKIEKMEDQIFQALSSNFPFFSLLIFLLFHLSIFVRPFFFFVFLGTYLRIEELALIFLLVQLIQAIQLTPGGLGILEGGIIGIFAILNLPPQYALGYAVFCRIGDLFFVGSGFLFLFQSGFRGDLIPSAKGEPSGQTHKNFKSL